MDELNNTFVEYMREFKTLTIEQKRNEILKSIKELIAIFESLAEADKIPIEYIKSKEILDIESSNTEHDFLEAEVVYIENAKSIIGQYLDKVLNV